MYYNVQSINKLGKKNLVEYALTKPKCLQLWHCFHYKLFIITTYEDLCSSSMN
jgi:hypothetical protein